MKQLSGSLIFKSGQFFEGISFGYNGSIAGEIVFSTGMVGYPEAFTDPSYEGQILVDTYPIVGSYGVPEKKLWESDRVHISGLIVSDYIDTPSHYQSIQTLGSWLKEQKVPALQIKDTRFLTQYLRDNGSQLGKIRIEQTHDIEFHDPNKENLVAKVSPGKIIVESGFDPDQGRTLTKQKTVLMIDCGAKRNMQRCLLKRGVRVITAPWDFDPFVNSNKIKCDGLIISNGPGDPKMADKTIQTIKKALENKIPTLGVCLGNQLLCLAAGGDTYKMKFGHRGQNQPSMLEKSTHCYITTQNHGFAVGDIPKGFKAWFVNANDGTNEGIIHEKYPFMSTQFHPEANPGPVDTEWVFDFFLEKLRIAKG